MKGEHYVMIDETCSCGSKIKIEHTSLREAEEFLVRWRSRHVHYKAPTFWPTVTYAGVGTSGAAYYTINNARPEDGPELSVVNS
jgi:hypothetical protein